MTARNCMDLAIVCPDVLCQNCNKPYQTWIWKENLLFNCPECSELGFSVEGLPIDEARLPKGSFFSDVEMPCEDATDPSCTVRKKMLFIDNYENLDFLKRHFQSSGSFENYTHIQKTLGMAYEMIVDMISQRTSR